MNTSFNFGKQTGVEVYEVQVSTRQDLKSAYKTYCSELNYNRMLYWRERAIRENPNHRIRVLKRSYKEVTTQVLIKVEKLK